MSPASPITVHATTAEQLERAEQILNAAGAFDIDQRAHEWRSEGLNTEAQTASANMQSASGSAVRGESMSLQGAETASANMQRANVGEGTSTTLPLIQEELQVGKRSVTRGGVRIFSKISETPVEESVRLREEHADVQRREVNRPATSEDIAAFKEGSFEVRETAEEAVVSKSARVVGEVEIGKRVTEREERVHDTIRKTEVDVEQLDSTRGTERGNI